MSISVLPKECRVPVSVPYSFAFDTLYLNIELLKPITKDSGQAVCFEADSIQAVKKKED